MTDERLDRFLEQLRQVLKNEPRFEDTFTGRLSVEISQGGLCDAQLTQTFKMKRKFVTT